MRIKKYEASDMKEAIRMIKKDFGPDAVILHSRTVNRGGFMGLFSKERIEVMAGADINIMEPPAEKRPSFPEIKPFQPETKEAAEYPPIVETVYSPKIVEKGEEMRPVTMNLERKVSFLIDEMENLKDTMNLIVKKVANSPHPMISPKLIMFYKGLERIGISEDIIINVLQEVESNFKGQELDNHDRILQYIRQKISALLKQAAPIDLDDPKGKRMVALVGPTGVGKTTTIAKMAATFSLIQKKNIALITIDTFRIAAIEQLRNYATIIGIPMEVVFNMDDFTRALRKFKSADLILIDTAGRSPKNQEQIYELKKFLSNSYIDVQLVLSATSKSKDLYDIIQRYNMIGGNGVIFTKLDETSSLGSIVDVVHKYGKHLTYFTDGQNVPDDFEIAYPNKLVNLMFQNIGRYMEN